MVLRKITVDNNVRLIPETEQTKEKDFRPKTIKAGSLPRRQNEKISQNIKKLLKNVAASGLASLTE